LSEKTPAYGITKETLDFIKDHSNLITKSALKNYYGITI